jgi:hypothetical protein
MTVSTVRGADMPLKTGHKAGQRGTEQVMWCSATGKVWPMQAGSRAGQGGTGQGGVEQIKLEGERKT